MPYLISFSPLKSSILKWFYLQEGFKVFWNTICRKDAKYKLYFLDLPAFVILHEHAHICSISKQQVFPKVLLPLVRNDHITNKLKAKSCQRQVLPESLMISRIKQSCSGVLALALPDICKTYQWSIFTQKNHLTIPPLCGIPTAFLRKQSVLSRAR